MAKERIIHISTELDTSGMLSGINQMRQMLGNINVDSNLFKDVNKDLDKITKDILEVKNSLKNGIPEKGVTSFLSKIESINKVYSSLPDKIKQVQINTQNIRFSDQVIQQLETLDNKIVKLGEDAKKALGENLKASLRNAIPKDIITDATLKNLTEATDKTKAFSDYFNQMADNAETAKAKVASSIKDIANTIVKNTDANASQKRAAFSQFGTAAMNALQGGAMVNVDAQAMAQNAANIGATKKQYEALQKAIIDYQTILQNSNNLLSQRQVILDIINKAESDATQIATQAANLTVQREQAVTNAIKNEQQAQQQAGQAAETHGKKATNALNQVSDSARKTNIHLQKQDSILKQLAMRATSLIGIGAVFNYITRGIRDAWNGIKELDKEFTQIAVVTDKTTSQLWQSFSTYSQMAQALGVTTKDAVATSALYYQQGLDTAEVMTLTAETIKMAQIAGMDFATATNQMTAALRGFNLEMSEAGRVNDIFSTLAANAAVSTQELAYALTKTASIAESAGMSIDTTSAFLTKMIETTREAPENIGTAMKSIVARFEELKSNPLALTVEVEGEEIVANKVEKAIALAGVRLRDETTGQFRDLDDVFLELAKSWEGLDRNTQRYIATIAAGSRQQSRFIALMDGYDRTLELVEMAQDSEGQSAAQFLKTLDSLDSKLNKITNSLESLYQKFVNSDFFGGLLDSLNNVLQNLGDFDAGTLAMLLSGGIILGNQLIRGIKIAFSKENNLTQLINEKINKGTANSVISNQNKRINKWNNFLNAEQEKHKYNNTNYNVQLMEQYRQLDKIEKKQDELTAKIQQKKSLNLTTDEAEAEIKQLENELNSLQAKKNEIENSDIVKHPGRGISRTNITKGNTYKGYVERANKREKQLDIDNLLSEEELKQKAQNISTSLVDTMSTVGPAMIGALSLGISMALNTKDPFEAVTTAILSFATTQLPTAINAIATVIKAGKDTVTAAGGWVTLAIEAIALVITGLVTLATWAVGNIKSQVQQIEEQLKNLEDSQKDLEESSERLTAEAAVEKTKYKNLNKLVQNYDNLIEKTGRTADENEKLNDIIENLATDFPDLIDYYDEAGNAVLKQRKDWESIVQLQKESAKEAAQSALGAKLASDLNQIQISKLNTQLKGAQAQEQIAQSYTSQNPWAFASWYGGAILNNQKTSAIQSISNIDFNNLDEVNELKKQLAYINTLNPREFTGQFRNYYKEAFSLPSTTLLQSTEEAQKWIDSLSDDNALKSELQKEFNDNQKVFLNKYQNFFKQIEDQVNALNLDYISEDTKKAIEQTRKDLQNYFVSYIQSFEPEKTEGFTEKGLQLFGQAFGEQQKEKITNQSNGNYMQERVGELTNIEGTAINSIITEYTTRTNKILSKELKDIINTIPNVTSWKDFDKLTLTAEQNTALSQIFGEMQAIDQQEVAEQLADIMPKIIDFTNQGLLDQQILNVINSGNYGAYGTVLLQQLADGLRKALGTEGAEVSNVFDKMVSEQTERLKNMPTGFREIGQKWGADLAQGLIDNGVSEQQVEKLSQSLNQIRDQSKISSILSMATSDTFDWGNSDQLKQLATQFVQAGDTAAQAVDHVLELRDVLKNPINLTLDTDKAVEDVTKVAESLNDLKKGLKDLNAAVQEYNENGRLSGETILDLVANGQLMYLEYDKQTKAITISKDAMVDYYNTQVAQAKLNLELKKSEAEQSIAALQQRRTNLVKQRQILVTAQEAEGRLTESQYEELTKLNNTYNEEILTNTSTFFTDMIDVYATGGNQLTQIAATTGANIRDALLTGYSADLSKIIDIEGTKATITSLVKGAETFAKGLPSYVKDIYKYQLDDTQIQAAIDKLDQEIKATDEFIAAQEKYLEMINKGIDITTALTESGLDNFLNDTAKAASEANKELKEYVSTLEKYYNLLKNIEHLEDDYERAQKEYDRNPTLENYQKVQQTRVALAEGYLTEKETFEKEKEEDVQRGTERFVNFGLDQKTAQTIMTLTNRGDINQDDLRPWLQKQGYDYDTAEKFEKIWEEVKKEIEEDNSQIKEADDKLYDLQIDAEEDLKKIEEELLALDRLTNVEQALNRLDKLMEKAENDLQAYYESGGREGNSLQQYLHSQGAALSELNTASGVIQQVKEDIVSDNKEMLDKYALEVDGEWYLNPDTIGNLNPNGDTYKALEGIFNQLNKIKEKEEEITDRQQAYAKAAKEALRVARKSYNDLVMKAANALAELDQKEIDEVKKKYAMIQEEDEKYLNALQKSIDKQRQLRDQAKSYDDLEEQEKRLALLERDTSGANASEIAALKEQIKDARQGLVDMEQDNIVNNISEANENRKEKMDEETTFLQNVMDERTYDMQYYIERAQDIVNAAIDGDEGAYKRLLEILQKTDEEFFRGTEQMREEWMEGWSTEITTASGYITSLKDGTVKLLGETTSGIIDTLTNFAKDDIEKVSEVEDKVKELEKVTKAVDMKQCFIDMQEEVKNAYSKIQELIDNFDGKNIHTQIEIEYKATGDIPGEGLYPNSPTNTSKWVAFDSSSGKITGIYDSEEEMTNSQAVNRGGSGISGRESTIAELNGKQVGDYLWKNQPKVKLKEEDKPSGSGDLSPSQQAPSSAPVQQESNLSEVSFNKWWDWWNSEGKANRIAIGRNGDIEGQVKVLGPTDADPEGNYHILNADSLKDAIMYWDNNKLKKLIKFDGKQVFKEGGLVDYTGPAWVDGTPTSPEAFLSANDTRNIQTLTEILQDVLVPASPSPTEKTATKSGDTNIEIHLEVGEISDDYDVNQMLDQIQERISEASEGQVTIVR